MSYVPGVMGFQPKDVQRTIHSYGSISADIGVTGNALHCENLCKFCGTLGSILFWRNYYLRVHTKLSNKGAAIKHLSASRDKNIVKVNRA